MATHKNELLGKEFTTSDGRLLYVFGVVEPFVIASDGSLHIINDIKFDE